MKIHYEPWNSLTQLNITVYSFRCQGTKHMTNEVKPMTEKLLTTSAAARRLNKSADTVRRLADSGQLPFFTIDSGGRMDRGFRLSDIERFDKKSQETKERISGK